MINLGGKKHLKDLSLEEMVKGVKKNVRRREVGSEGGRDSPKSPFSSGMWVPLSLCKYEAT